MKVGDKIKYKNHGENCVATVIRVEKHADTCDISRQLKTFVTLDDGDGERYIGHLEVLMDAAAGVRTESKKRPVNVIKKKETNEVVRLNGMLTRAMITLANNLTIKADLEKKYAETTEPGERASIRRKIFYRKNYIELGNERIKKYEERLEQLVRWT